MNAERYIEQDERIIKGFIKGEAKALQAVYDLHHDHLYYFAYKLTGDMGEAEDITIETLGIVLRRHQDFVTMANIKAFLYITVRNKSLKYLEFVQRQKYFQSSFSKVVEKKDDPILSQIVLAEFYRAAYQEMENLPKTQSNVVKMFFIEGLSHGEIAEKLNITVESVRNNKSRALKELKNILLKKKLLILIAGIVKIY